MEWYQQTTPYTTAVCSLMMALNHFNPSFPLDEETELNIWQQTVVTPTKSASIYALGLYVVEQHVPVKIIVGTHEYKFPRYRFQGYKLKEVETASKVSELIYKKAKHAGIAIEEREFDFDEPLTLLTEGKVLLLRLNTGLLHDFGDKLASHYFALFADVKNDKIITVADPLLGIRPIDVDILRQSFLAVKEKSKRDPRMLVMG